MVPREVCRARAIRPTLAGDSLESARAWVDLAQANDSCHDSAPAPQEAEGPKSTTPGYYTRLTYLISDGIQGVRRADGNPFLKRIAYAVYQHVTGNGELDDATREMLRKQRSPKVSKREVELARVSVRLLKSLKSPHDPETILCELGGLWSDDVIEAAIKLEFQL